MRAGENGTLGVVGGGTYTVLHAGEAPRFRRPEEGHHVQLGVVDGAAVIPAPRQVGHHILRHQRHAHADAEQQGGLRAARGPEHLPRFRLHIANAVNHLPLHIVERFGIMEVRRRAEGREDERRGRGHANSPEFAHGGKTRRKNHAVFRRTLGQGQNAAVFLLHGRPSHRQQSRQRFDEVHS